MNRTTYFILMIIGIAQIIIIAFNPNSPSKFVCIGGYATALLLAIRNAILGETPHHQRKAANPSTRKWS
jgi:hypothetical protein